ncbi:MAG TPA: hypothetical protein VNF68_05290 [Candidatus Baltobacteraceae bacterium]|nr:hypothetical protein [Candidatus Baltobacteraceae bacterium]
MTSVRDKVALFIKDEGHRVDVSALEDGAGVAELLFRTRGQVFSVTTDERDAATFTVATAYEIPELARENTTNAETLANAQAEFADVDFAMAHDGSLFIVSTQEAPGSPEAFAKQFWTVVARVREAGTYAIERIVDRTESKAAADKFISSLTMGER